MRVADDDNRGKQDGEGEAVPYGILDMIIGSSRETPCYLTRRTSFS